MYPDFLLQRLILYLYQIRQSITIIKLYIDLIQLIYSIKINKTSISNIINSISNYYKYFYPLLKPLISKILAINIYFKSILQIRDTLYNKNLKNKHKNQFKIFIKDQLIQLFIIEEGSFNLQKVELQLIVQLGLVRKFDLIENKDKEIRRRKTNERMNQMFIKQLIDNVNIEVQRQQKLMKKSIKRTQPLQLIKSEDYLNFIIKNHMLMQNITQVRQDKNNNNFRKIVNAKIQDCKHKIKNNFQTDVVQISNYADKVFHPPFIFPQKEQPVNQIQSDDKCITYDMLIQIMQIKNQQIAEQLLKERKSMGQIVYRYEKDNSKSLDRGLNIIKPRDYTERKNEKNYKTNILKFPLLMKKNISTKGNEKSREKIIKILKQQQKNNQNHHSNQTKLDLNKEHQIFKKLNHDSTNIQNRTNQKILQAYYQNQLQITIKQQKYQCIPQYKPPKHIFKKEKAKKKQKYIINQEIEKNPQIGEIISKQLTQYLQSNIKSIQLSRNRNKRSQNHDKQEGLMANTLFLNEQEQLISKKLENKLILQQNEKIIIQKAQQKTIQQQNSTKLTKKHSQIVRKSKSKKNILYFERDNQNIYQNKIKYYRQFLFLMNLAHRIFDPLVLKEEFKNQIKYKYYIGKGNNSLLVKSLLKRRFWWIPEDDPKKANFVWTQLKLNTFYQYQHKSHQINPYDKIQDQQQQIKNTKKKIKNPHIYKPGVYKPPLPIGSSKILTYTDQKYYQQLINNADAQKISNFTNRLKYFPTNFLENRQNDKSDSRIHNHFQHNYFIGNKKALFYNLKQYYQLVGKDVFTVIPLTFHIQHGTSDIQYHNFIKQFQKIRMSDKNKTILKNVWIVKPGQLSNRGSGITVIDQVYQLNNILKRKEKHSNGSEKTYIIQKYIEKPLLYNRRKFDIRHYMIISRLHGRIRAYWYGEGYIRTSCYEYNIQQIDNEFMHLTNDAIQKNAYGYGKYEQANKVSYNEFQRYLDSNFPEKKILFSQKIYPKMKEIALDAFRSTYLKLDPDAYQHNFQIFGFDFMIDNIFNVWLIQVNTNPCLQINCSILNRIIPTMLQHTFRLTLDVLFPPTSQYPNSQKYLAPDNPLQRLQFQLIFDEARDGFQISKLYENVKSVEINNIDQQDQIYENQGKELQLEGEIQ